MRTSVFILPVDFRFQPGNPYTRFSKKASRVQYKICSLSDSACCHLARLRSFTLKSAHYWIVSLIFMYFGRLVHANFLAARGGLPEIEQHSRAASPDTYTLCTKKGGRNRAAAPIRLNLLFRMISCQITDSTGQAQVCHEILRITTSDEHPASLQFIRCTS